MPAVLDLKTGNVQIEQGESVTDYQEHEEQNINFTLSENQNFYAGDYLADDGIHHVMKQETVSGTEATFSDAKTNGAYWCSQKTSGNLSDKTITFDSSVTDAVVQYELAEEVIDSYTSEQQTVWDQIKALKTYTGGTHISSENNIPALLKIQYWKEA